MTNTNVRRNMLSIAFAPLPGWPGVHRLNVLRPFQRRRCSGRIRARDGSRRAMPLQAASYACALIGHVVPARLVRLPCRSCA
jgi:hypothetical protein